MNHNEKLKPKFIPAQIESCGRYCEHGFCEAPADYVLRLPGSASSDPAIKTHAESLCAHHAKLVCEQQNAHGIKIDL